MRHGQWVSTSKQIEGAHQLNGRSIGIYQRGAKDDGRGVSKPEHVAIVKPNGENLMKLSACGNVAEPVQFHPSELPDLKVETDPAAAPRPGAHRA